MTLVVMAAGLGSRYGGLKQLDPVGPAGEIIIDYSVYDAKNAGFDTVIFIIKKENHDLFKEVVSNKYKGINVKYAFQALDDIPEGYAVPEGRIKPWGTGHAVYSARELIDGPFAVINADDFYGRDAFVKLYDALKNGKQGEYFAVGYELKNTVTKSGTVSRGVCTADGEGYLESVTERLKIGYTEKGDLAYFDFGEGVPLDEGTLVSMNFWGFSEDFKEPLAKGFEEFLKAERKDPLKDEYYLPTAVTYGMKNGAKVKLLHTNAVWHGITYKEDKEDVVRSLEELRGSGEYPDRLWEE